MADKLFGKDYNPKRRKRTDVDGEGNYNPRLLNVDNLISNAVDDLFASRAEPEIITKDDGAPAMTMTKQYYETTRTRKKKKKDQNYLRRIVEGEE